MKYIVKGRRPRWLKNASPTPRGWVDSRTGKMLFVTPLQIIVVPDEQKTEESVTEVAEEKVDIQDVKTDIQDVKTDIQPEVQVKEQEKKESVEPEQEEQPKQPKKRTSNRKRKTPTEQVVNEDGQV